MPTELFANDPPAITLNGAITAAATSITVSSSTGWPAASTGAGTQFRVRIDNEYLNVTNVSGTTWTVVRGMEGSVAATHATGAPVNHVVTANTLNYLLNLVKFSAPAADDPDGVLYWDPNADETSLGYREVGEYIWWSAAALPLGYVECNGQAISRTAYPELFALWGTFYGAGDGSTTFGVPDGKKRMLVHRDASNTAFDTLGETGGAQTVTLTEPQMPVHTHNLLSGVWSEDVGPADWQFNSGTQISFRRHAYPGLSNAGGSSGTTQPHENMPPYLVARLLVRATPYANVGSGTVASLPDYGCRVRRTSTGSVAQGAWVALDWHATDWDTSTYWAVGQPTRLTIPPGLGGKYHVEAHIGLERPAGFDQILCWFINGVEQAFLRDRGREINQMLHSVGTVNLVPGDYLDVRLNHSDTGALPVPTNYVAAAIQKVA